MIATCSSPWQPSLFRPPGIELLPAYGTVTVCTVVGTLAPHAFVASTEKVGNGAGPQPWR